jgi:outer membrane protein assembly factor BamB
MVALWVLLMSACSPGTEDGGTEDAALDANTGDQLWKFQTGGQIWSTPVVNDGTVFFGSDDGNFYALDLATRDPIWKFSTGGIVRSRGAICDGKVIFVGDDGHLYALDTASGSVTWKLDTGGGDVSRRLPATDPPYDYDYMASSPVCSENSVYVGTADGHLLAVDLASGAERWRFETNGKIRSSPLLHADEIYFGSWDQHVYALNAATGEEVWKFDTGGVVQASPAYGEGKIFIGSRNPKIFALDAETGLPAWEYVHEDGSWVESSAVFADGVLYIGSSDALALQALDATDGSELWRYTTGGWSWGTPVVSGDTVYIGSISAYPYYFDGVDLERGFHAVDRATGTMRWRLETGELIGGYLTGGVFSSPVVADGAIYVTALDGSLYALKE